MNTVNTLRPPGQLRGRQPSPCRRMSHPLRIPAHQVWSGLVWLGGGGGRRRRRRKKRIQKEKCGFTVCIDKGAMQSGSVSLLTLPSITTRCMIWKHTQMEFGFSVLPSHFQVRETAENYSFQAVPIYEGVEAFCISSYGSLSTPPPLGEGMR